MKNAMLYVLIFLLCFGIVFPLEGNVSNATEIFEENISGSNGIIENIAESREFMEYNKWFNESMGNFWVNAEKFVKDPMFAVLLFVFIILIIAVILKKIMFLIIRIGEKTLFFLFFASVLSLVCIFSAQHFSYLEESLILWIVKLIALVVSVISFIFYMILKFVPKW